MTQKLICTSCGYIGASQRKVKGSLGVEIVLWFFFLIPGLIYSIWRSSSRYKACPVCGSTNLVPVDSPIGRKMLQDQGKNVDQMISDEKVESTVKRKKIIKIVAITIGILILINILGSL